MFLRRPSISRAWQKRFAFLGNVNRGGSAAVRVRNTGAVKVAIALTAVENLSRTPSNENLMAVAAPRKGLADSLKREPNGRRSSRKASLTP